MPVKSYAQAAWLKHNRPDIYSRWKKKYGIPSGLPQHVDKGKSEYLKRKT